MATQEFDGGRSENVTPLTTESVDRGTEPMDLDLVINDVTVQLGDRRRPNVLELAGFSRIGLFGRLTKKIPLGQTWYRSPNCTLTCFGEEFVLYPCLDNYLDRDRRWGTDAMLRFAQDRLCEVRLQVVDGHYAAANFLDRLCEVCTSHFGPPDKESQYRMVWRSEKASFICTMQPDLINADFRWLQRPNGDET